MRHHYQAIGGRSPLTTITLAQAAALRERLGRRAPVAVGMRNWTPFIKDAIAELAGKGVTRIVGIPMAPQFSTLSVQKYHEAATASLPPGVAFDAGRVVLFAPLLVAAFAERVAAAAPRPDELDHLYRARPAQARDRIRRSVCGRSRSDRKAVAERAGLTRYRLAFQSAGRTPEPWIGPEIQEVIDEESATRRPEISCRADRVRQCDHTEILFDIDIQAAQTAREFSTTLRRTESLNTSPTFISLLEDLVRSRI